MLVTLGNRLYQGIFVTLRIAGVTAMTKNQPKKLTAIKLDQIKPGETRKQIPDAGCAGLYYIVQPSGARSWSIWYRRQADRKQRKVTLSGSLSLAAARAKAAGLLEQVAKGEDPAASLQIEKQAART